MKIIRKLKEAIQVGCKIHNTFKYSNVTENIKIILETRKKMSSFFFFLATLLGWWNFSLPDEELNWGSQQCKHGVLTNGLSGNA